MKTAQSIIEWYDSYNLDQGLEPLLKARQRLSVYCVGIAEQIERAEAVSSVAYHQRKLREAQAFLEAEGTNAERTAKSIDEATRLEEAAHEGELRGLKIMLQTYNKVLDSMAGQINTLNR